MNTNIKGDFQICISVPLMHSTAYNTFTSHEMSHDNTVFNLTETEHVFKIS